MMRWISHSAQSPGRLNNFTSAQSNSRLNGCAKCGDWSVSFVSTVGLGSLLAPLLEPGIDAEQIKSRLPVKWLPESSEEFVPAKGRGRYLQERGDKNRFRGEINVCVCVCVCVCSKLVLRWSVVIVDHTPPKYDVHSVRSHVRFNAEGAARPGDQKHVLVRKPRENGGRRGSGGI